MNQPELIGTICGSVFGFLLIALSTFYYFRFYKPRKDAKKKDASLGLASLSNATKKDKEASSPFQLWLMNHRQSTDTDIDRGMFFVYIYKE